MSTIVAGIMSGTSADGIDVALVAIGAGHSGKGRRRRQAEASTDFRLLGHAAFPYPLAVRRAVLAAMNSPSARVVDLARLNFLLGELYADALEATQKKFRLRVSLAGCHGQTLYHQGSAERFLGHRLAVTWQTGEATRIAARVGVPVISDFRPADMAAGGKGAPLVPYLDYLLYRDRRIGRIALNLGGIANVTAIPARAAPGQVIAFDTGPANMVIDALALELFGRRYDRDGKLAARGRLIEPVIRKFLAQPYFSLKPPKTAGREQFGGEFAQKFLAQCARALPARPAGRIKSDCIRTATAFTSRSIADGLRKHVLPHAKFSEVIASGGGARNPVLMQLLEEELRPLGIGLRSSDEFGIPAEAKEAVAFAVMAHETWNRRPSNLPAATGATRAVVLGKIAYP
jgi:anhydro-N-acetylmuramic acid kinase